MNGDGDGSQLSHGWALAPSLEPKDMSLYDCVGVADLEKELVMTTLLLVNCK